MAIELINFLQKQINDFHRPTLQALIRDGQVKLNNITVEDDKLNVSLDNFESKKILKLSHGKKNHVILKLS